MDCRDIPLCFVDWTSSARIIASCFPPTGLFDDVSDPDDLDIVFEIEALTNPRLREEAGDISLIPAGKRICGPGTTPIMAAFTHLNPDGSRFSDGSYGIYYASKSLDTAIKETIFHRERFLRYSHEAPIELDQRVYYADINAELSDIRPFCNSQSEWYDPDNYAASQTLARELRKANGNGFVFSSVRHCGGECVAAFYPCLLSPARQGPHLTYVWDGNAIVQVYEKRELAIL